MFTYVGHFPAKAPLGKTLEHCDGERGHKLARSEGTLDRYFDDKKLLRPDDREEPSKQSATFVFFRIKRSNEPGYALLLLLGISTNACNFHRALGPTAK